MLTWFQDVVIVVCSVLGSLGFLWLTYRFWPSMQRREHNEIIGWQVSMLGTTYAVIMGFMLYAVWTAFNTAQMNAGNESNSLVNVYRLANGLPPESRDEIQKLARDYTGAMLSKEWEAMDQGDLSLEGHRIITQLWDTVTETKTTSLAEQTVLDHTITELGAMTQARRMRELESKSKLPGILWAMLILGGVITTLSSCLFGTDNFKLHAIQVFCISFLLSLALVAIGDVDRPFRGSVHVEPLGFERARATFDQSKDGFK